MTARRKKLQMDERDGMLVMNMGNMDIWDGADLSLLRDTLYEIIVQDHVNKIGINMDTVKCIQSGFFGMLIDWHDRGIQIFLVEPLPNVRRMLWFRRFAAPVSQGLFELTSIPQQELTPAGVGNWDDDEPIDDDWHENAFVENSYDGRSSVNEPTNPAHVSLPIPVANHNHSEF